MARKPHSSKSEASLVHRRGRSAYAAILVIAAMTAAPLSRMYWEAAVELRDGPPAFALFSRIFLISNLLVMALIFGHMAMVGRCLARLGARPLGRRTEGMLSAVMACGLVASFLFIWTSSRGGWSAADTPYLAGLIGYAVCAAGCLVIRSREVRAPAAASSEEVSLVVVREDGATLVDAAVAKRSDYWVGADLPGGRATLDLYGHYEAFKAAGGVRPYRAHDGLAKTYVKFGHVIQDKIGLTVEIRPAHQTPGPRLGICRRVLSALILFAGICALGYVTDAVAQSASRTRLKLRSPTAEQRRILREVLGDEFISDVRVVYPAKLEVAEVDLNSDGKPDLIASQRARCSNHACEYEVLMSAPSGYRRAATLESWNVPQVAAERHAGAHDLIIWDHVTDDCMACSQPVRMAWSPSSYTAEGDKGAYISQGPAPRTRR